MSLSEVPVNQVTEATLRKLVENQVRESITLDYKRDLPGKGDDDAREFLRDVTAFANSEGGDLLFGISEAEGVASELTGVTSSNMDADVRRLIDYIKDCTDPRLHGFSVRAVELPTGSFVVHVRIPKSLEAPHMVQRGNYRQFFTRNPAGKHPMSTNEIRNAVLRTADWKERADAWRRERVALVEAGEGTVLGPCPKFDET